MKFTYDAYRDLLKLLKKNDYTITDYGDCDKYEKCVILRHDVDNDLKKALDFAKLEQGEGVTSTYFILLSSPFYNIATRENLDIIKEISSMGHTIGLHFDEVKYANDINMADMIKKEKSIMEAILDISISSVSMHRPSENTLRADYDLGEVINSYGAKFFREFKYVSDSRRNWREDVIDIVNSNEHNKLHIVTHAFWYENKEITIEQSLKNFVQAGLKERYANECDNIRDFETIISLEDCYEDLSK